MILRESLKLALKDAPGAGDDFIDLHDETTGYFLQEGGYTEGEERTDNYGRQVRDLSITVNIQGKTYAQLQSRYNKIWYFIRRTKSYLKKFGGLLPARKDNQWFSGLAAVLTYSPFGTNSEVYWDVIDGDVSNPNGGRKDPLNLNGVVVTLTVRSMARGVQRSIRNPIAGGDWAEPIDITSETGFNADWIVSTNGQWSLDTTLGKYGPRCLKGVSSSFTPVTLISDSCNRSDSTSTMGNANTGQAWSPQVGTWGIISNEAYNQSSVNGALTFQTASQADYNVSCRVSGQISGGNYSLPAVVFRGNDASNFLYVDLYGPAVRLLKVAGGGITVLKQNINSTLIDGVKYRFNVLCQGNNIAVFLDGALFLTYTLAGGDTVYNTYTKCGLYHQKGGSPSVAARWDDFRIEGAIYSNEFSDFAVGDNLLPAIWLRGVISSGSLLVKLQIYTNGVWSDQQTLTISPALSNSAWQQYVGVFYTVASGVTKARLAYTLPTTGTVYFDGSASWVNPLNNTVPVEYATGGYQFNLSYFNFYDAQGTEETPIDLRVVSPSSQTERAIVVGGHSYDYSQEYPLLPLDLKVLGKISCSFTHTDDSALMYYTDNGHAWAVQAGTWGINSNKGYSVSDATDNLVWIETSVADFTASVKVSGTLASGANFRTLALMFHGNDASNFLMLHLLNGNLELYKKVAGVFTLITSAPVTGGTLDGTDYVIGVVCSGNSVSATAKDATGVTTLASLSTTLAGGDTVFAGYTKLGFRLGKGGAPASAARVDDLLVTWTLPAAPSLPWSTKGVTFSNTSLPASGIQVVTYPLWYIDPAFANRTIDKTPRRYRLMLATAFNFTNPNINKIRLIINGEARDLTTTLLSYPNPVAGAGVPTDGDYRVYDTEDFVFFDPGNGWVEQTEVLGAQTLAIQFPTAGTNSGAVTQTISLLGAILIPAQQYASVDLVTPTDTFGVEIINHSLVPQTGFDETGLGTTSLKTLGYNDVTATKRGNKLYLIPADPNTVNRFEVLPLRSLDIASGSNKAGWKFSASDYYQVSAKYAPLYRTGQIA